MLRLPPSERPVEAERLGVVARPVEVERPAEVVRAFDEVRPAVRLPEDVRFVEL